MPGAKSPVHPSARSCSPKNPCHQSPSLTEFGGPGREQERCQHLAQSPALPARPSPPQAPTSPSHKTNPALLLRVGMGPLPEPGSATAMPRAPDCQSQRQRECCPLLWASSRAVTATQKLSPPLVTVATTSPVVGILFLERECYYGDLSITDVSKMSLLYKNLHKDIDQGCFRTTKKNKNLMLLDKMPLKPSPLWVCTY